MGWYAAPAMSQPIRAVFFDAGHTLIESRPSVAGIYRRSAGDFGVFFSEERAEALLQVLGSAYAEATAQAMETAITDEADKAMWHGVTRRVYDTVPELQAIAYDPWFEHLHAIFVDPATWQPYAETVEVLTTLRARGLRIAVVSNWSSNLPRILDGLGLTAYFDAVVVSCIEGCRKPSPSIFHRALERTAMTPGEVLHVGDTYEDDVLGASAVGIGAVLLNRNGRTCPPCPVVTDLRGILPLLGKPAPPFKPAAQVR